MIHAWNHEILRRDLAGGIASSVRPAERVHEVELGGDSVVREVAAPQSSAGRTLAALDLRVRTGALVLLIRRPSAWRGAAGSREALERLEAL